MKASVLNLILFSLFIFTFLSATDSFSLPLNGTYTIGSGGNYPTIDSAVNDARAQGIIGPVVFDIIPGVYNENIRIFQIPGSSPINTLTIKSQTNNFNDVNVNILLVAGSNIILRDLSFISPVEISGWGNSLVRNVDIINNNFSNNGLNVYTDWLFYMYDISFTGNINVGNVGMFGEFWIGSGRVDSVLIKNNIINGNLTFDLCKNILIENNTIT